MNITLHPMDKTDSGFTCKICGYTTIEQDGISRVVHEGADKSNTGNGTIVLHVKHVSVELHQGDKCSKQQQDIKLDPRIMQKIKQCLEEQGL